MKKKELKDLRKKDLKELVKLIDKNKLELLKIKAEAKVGKQQDLKKVKKARRDLAQMMTIMKELKLIEKFKEKKNQKAD